MIDESRGAAPQRDLDRGQLRELVAGVGADPARWRPLVRHATGGRHFEQLWRDDHVDVWVISWGSGSDTGFHDHDVSSGAVAVLDGELIEERLTLGRPRLRRHPAGAVFDFDAAHIHRMRQDSDVPAISVHAYSPPLWRMGS